MSIRPVDEIIDLIIDLREDLEATDITDGNLHNAWTNLIAAEECLVDYLRSKAKPGK